MSRAGASRGPKNGPLGRKWVDTNFDARERAKARYGNDLSQVLALQNSWHPNAGQWSEHKLPEILFYLFVPRSKYFGQETTGLHDENGIPIRNSAGNVVGDFEILPERISLDAPAWLIETWRRIDCRIGYNDILDRMIEDATLGLRKQSRNCLSNNSRRSCRKILNSWVEYGRREDPHRTEVEAIEKLSHENVKYNTILKPCSLAPDRLVKVKFVRDREMGLCRLIPLTVTRHNIWRTTLHVSHFLANTIPATGNPLTAAMEAAWEMSCRLSERAMLHEVSHWSKLPRPCFPSSWFDRTKDKSASHSTDDGGCDICTYKPDPKYVATEATPLVAGEQSFRKRKSIQEDCQIDDQTELNKRLRRMGAPNQYLGAGLPPHSGPESTAEWEKPGNLNTLTDWQPPAPIEDLSEDVFLSNTGSGHRQQYDLPPIVPMHLPQHYTIPHNLQTSLAGQLAQSDPSGSHPRLGDLSMATASSSALPYMASLPLWNDNSSNLLDTNMYGNTGTSTWQNNYAGLSDPVGSDINLVNATNTFQPTDNLWSNTVDSSQVNVLDLDAYQKGFQAIDQANFGDLPNNVDIGSLHGAYPSNLGMIPEAANAADYTTVALTTPLNPYFGNSQGWQMPAYTVDTVDPQLTTTHEAQLDNLQISQGAVYPAEDEEPDFATPPPEEEL